MKNSFLILTIAGVAIVGLQSLTPAIVKKDGAAGGYTGSPGDSSRNCTACHGGTAVLVDNWIISDIPAEGYTPGQTYTITAINNESGATRFGFEVSPQDMQGNYMGKMIITDSVRTKLVADSTKPGSDYKYITYTADGVDGIGSAQWSFNWTAPAAGAGEVTFYGGFNSNFEGHKDGDKTYLSTLTVSEKGGNSINKLNKASLNYIQYPNPASENLSIGFNLSKKEKVAIDLIDITGKTVQQLYQGMPVVVGRQNVCVDILPSVPRGTYFIRTTIGQNSYSESLIIK